MRLVTGARFDPGFGVALALTLTGGAILAAGSLFGRGALTLGGGEIIVLLSNAIWTLYSLKAQAWFDGEPAAPGLCGFAFRPRLDGGPQPGDGRLRLGQLTVCGHRWLGVEPASAGGRLFSGMGAYLWNVGASRLGVAIASLWSISCRFSPYYGQ